MKKVFNDLAAAATTSFQRNTWLAINDENIRLIQNPEDVLAILKDRDRSTIKHLNWLRQALGPSRISENGDAWRIRRELSQEHYHTFDSKILHQNVESVLDAIIPRLSGSSVEHECITNLELYSPILEIFCRTFFNRTLHDVKIDASLLYDIIEDASRNSYISDEWHPQILPEQSRAHLLRMLNNREAVLRSLSLLRTNQAQLAPILQAITDAEKVYPDICFEQEVLTILAAGTESTSAALGWILHLLAKNPDLQELARCEAEDNILNERIEFVVNYALRVFPAFPFLSRMATNPINIEGGVINPGETFLISILGAQGRASMDSHRTLEDSYNNKSLRLNFAFGSGDRACGGRAFAVRELILMTAGILRRSVLLLSDRDTGPLRWRLSLVFDQGQPVKLIRT